MKADWPGNFGDKCGWFQRITSSPILVHITVMCIVVGLGYIPNVFSLTLF